MCAHVHQRCQAAASINGTVCYSSEASFSSFSSHIVPHFTTARFPATCSLACSDSRSQGPPTWSLTFVSTPHRTSLTHLDTHLTIFSFVILWRIKGGVRHLRRFSHLRVISPRRSRIFSLVRLRCSSPQRVIWAILISRSVYEA